MGGEVFQQDGDSARAAERSLRQFAPRPTGGAGASGLGRRHHRIPDHILLSELDLIPPHHTVQGGPRNPQPTSGVGHIETVGLQSQ